MNKIKAAAGALAKRRKRTEKRCESCGQVFQGLGWSRFCQPKCRQMAWQKAKRARTPEQP